jgi:hypothetical protein
MGTQATISRLDLLCETLGVSLETLAKRARIAPEDLCTARDERWHPTTILRLWEHLGIPLSFFDIPTAHLAELLKAFSVVEPLHRFTLIDKIWNSETVLRAATEEHILERILPTSKPLRLDDNLLGEFNYQRWTGHQNFVAFVRRRLEDAHVLLFSHPFGNDDYTAILFVPNAHNSAFMYLVVNENEWLSPQTNALFQWYEVLRLLSRWDNTDDDDGFTIDSNASWTVVYLESAAGRYCPRVNELLHKCFFFRYIFPRTLEPKQYQWASILIALAEGLPPAVVAEILSSGLEGVDEESVDAIIRSLNQPSVIDKIVRHLVSRRMLPTDYDWTIPSYPSLVKRTVLQAVAQRRFPRHLVLSVLSIPDYEYDILLQDVELLSKHSLPAE